MSGIRKVLAAAVVGLGALMSHQTSQAALVVCGDASLGVRVTTVDPAKDPNGLCYAGLTNLGDGQLVTLLDSLTGDTGDVGLIDRDEANTNGDDLLITGVGGTEGTWSFTASLWNSYERLFLYFHFGDAQDDPGLTSETDPDIFIVELMSPDAMGDWLFGPSTAKLTGLSNIALLWQGLVEGNGNGNGNGGGPGGLPEPSTVGLIGLGMLAIGALRRRKTRVGS